MLGCGAWLTTCATTERRCILCAATATDVISRIATKTTTSSTARSLTRSGNRTHRTRRTATEYGRSITANVATPHEAGITHKVAPSRCANRRCAFNTRARATKTSTRCHTVVGQTGCATLMVSSFTRHTTHLVTARNGSTVGRCARGTTIATRHGVVVVCATTATRMKSNATRHPTERKSATPITGCNTVFWFITRRASHPTVRRNIVRHTLIATTMRIGRARCETHSADTHRSCRTHGSATAAIGRV
jgi:hypothetical protein